MARKFKADIRRDAVCAACGTRYYYFHALELNEYDSEKFDAKVRNAVANGVGVAPCPACGGLNPEMRKAHWKALNGHLLGVAGAVALLLFCWMMAVEGAFFYILVPVAALALLAYLSLIIYWAVILMAPGILRRDSIIPGREDEASPKVKGKIAEWARRGPLG